MDDGPQRLLGWLGAHPGTWTSAELAAALGVTSRSVRNYITALNAGAEDALVERTAKGYRLTPATSSRAVEPSAPSGAAAPQRAYTVLRRILTSPEPVSVYDLANELGVSESTIDNDLRRITELAERHEVTVLRSGDIVRAEGRETDQRRLMRQATTDAANPGAMLATSRLESAYASYDVRQIKRHVARALSTNGLHCNDYALNPLILDLVIAVDRITDDYTLGEAGSDTTAQTDPRLAGAAREITSYLSQAYGVRFSVAETEAVALLVASKTTLLRGATDRDVVVDHVGPELVSLVRCILTKLDETYLVDLTDDAFVASLALHTHNLLLRAQAGRPQPNPLAAAIRKGHPLVHELAVFFTRELEQETGVPVHPDEVGFIAFHLGAALDRRRDGRDQIAITLVAPGYHDLTQRIAERLTTQLGDRIVIDQIIETGEPDAGDVTGELVVSPLPVPGLHPARQILISPLLSQADIDLVDVQVRAQQRRNTWMRLVGQLHELFHDGLFYRSPRVSDRDGLLGLLCGALRRHEAVPEDFLAQVHERERLSPTAFNDVVAIPHTLGMPAERTSIAVAAFDEPIDWAGTPVRLVLLVAFSAEDRNLFRDTFDQLVITLTEPANVNRLVERGRTFEDFVAELGRLMQSP
jgi:lichenan operon transcriptional antiterminator